MVYAYACACVRVYKTLNTTQYVGFFIMPRIRAVLSTFTLTRQSKQKKLNRPRTSLRVFFLNIHRHTELDCWWQWWG